ncbi:MAG: hypothetical protein JSR82_01835 [Verrucomicrobia bacterium]|nr:hypothetical protein [Verrucomicrobiota bacterium]
MKLALLVQVLVLSAIAQIASAETQPISGVVLGGGKPLGGVRVELLMQTGKNSGLFEQTPFFQRIGVATSDKHGRFAFKTGTLKSGAHYKAVFRLKRRGAAEFVTTKSLNVGSNSVALW